MKIRWTRGISVAICGGALLAGPQPARAAVDGQRIMRQSGLTGQDDPQERGVFKIAVPRTDLRVMVGGIHVTPPMGLTSWAAFKGTGAGDRDMVMGDLVLEEDQVNPVMSAALDNGLEVTALHNHFFWDSPKVMFMHIGGMGREEALATAVGKVFARIKETSGGRADPPVASIDPAQTTLDPKKIEAILETPGQLANGVYKVTVGRSTREHAQEMGSAMGVSTWAAFAGSDSQAVVDGDFAMRDSELQSVLKALRRSDINIVAIHQHMTGEEPRMLFLHYWGVGPTEQLARGLRAALDQTSERGLKRESSLPHH